MASRPTRLSMTAVLLGVLLLGACQPVYFRTMNALTPGANAESRVFDTAHGLSLDVFRARNANGPVPVVVFFHGGSWRTGDRRDYRFVGEALSRQGVLVLVPDYRKAPRFPFPAFMEDAAAATAWARDHARELGADPGRVYVMGHSAGAQIAALLATDGRYLARWNMRPRDLAGAIGLAGPYDFLPITDPRLRQVFDRQADWPASQPVNFVDGDEPPFLLLHGDRDRLVRKINSEKLAARLRAAGEPVTMHVIHGAGHSTLLSGFMSARFSPVVSQSIDWIDGGESVGSGAGSGNSPPR